MLDFFDEEVLVLYQGKSVMLELFKCEFLCDDDIVCVGSYCYQGKLGLMICFLCGIVICFLLCQIEYLVCQFCYSQIVLIGVKVEVVVV